MLTPISPEQLRPALERFMAGLDDPFCRAVFCRIRATSADRATGREAERHRQAALALAGVFSMPVHPRGAPCRFN